MFAPNRPRRLAVLLAGAMATGILGATLWFAATPSAPRLIHTEPSDFESVLVFEDESLRCMDFTEADPEGRQTCMDLAQPEKMVFEYTRMMTSALFLNPQPRTILIVGLGGGTLSRAFAAILPDAVVDTVEIDPAVARVAERYFGYEPGPRQRLFIEDGRRYVEGAVAEGRHYDMVMLDAFDVDYIPAHLLTLQFLESVRELLSKDGVLVANTFTNSEMYDRESATYAAVFGDFFNLRAGNRVIIARRGDLPDQETLRRNADALAGRLAPFGIDVEQELARYSRERDWDEGAATLSDPE